MVTAVRQISFLFAPALLVFAIAQGQGEKAEKIQHSAVNAQSLPVETKAAAGVDTGQAINARYVDQGQINENTSSSEVVPSETGTEKNQSPDNQEKVQNDSAQEMSESGLATFFALMKNQRYADANRVLRTIEATARASSNGEQTAKCKRLRENLEALCK